jgi:hypothetical protein
MPSRVSTLVLFGVAITGTLAAPVKKTQTGVATYGSYDIGDTADYA